MRIDALETHYGSPRTHQPLAWRTPPPPSCSTGWVSAMSFAHRTKRSHPSTPDTVAGYILTPRGRPLRALHLPSSDAATRRRPSGSRFFVDVDALRTTANHHLIKQGLAYPTYYRALFPDLRNELTAAAKQARDSRDSGCGPATQPPPAPTSPGSTPSRTTSSIVPKLFRRLVDYLHLGDDSMAGFPAFLDQAADKFFILSTGHSTTGLDAVVEVDGNKVKMTQPIEDLVFDEK